MRRPRLSARSLLLLAALAFPAARLIAHVPLIHPSSGVTLRWGVPQVPVVLQADGSEDAGADASTAALRLALLEWNAAAGTSTRLVEDTTSAQRERTDYTARDLHLLTFDEGDLSGFFPAGSATVALTPVWFASGGTIQDADVLFNGRGFAFTTRGTPGAFDIQDVATHELGHLLGLDHSGAAGATMYPYVAPDMLQQRSLSEDERAALRDASGGAGGRISGSVRRLQDDSPVAGAYLVARDEAGRTRASILADRQGGFVLRGLEPGSYTVYARPLDSPVAEANLGPGYRGAIETDFEPAYHPVPVPVGAAGTSAVGVLYVGGDVALALGSPSDRFPFPAVAGETRRISVHGSGLFTGSVLSASDPDLELGPPLWQGNLVSFDLSVPTGEVPGHVDLEVRGPSGKRAILPAAIEITVPPPRVESVVPALGSAGGGDPVTIAGTGFAPGSRVVVADRIYVDGIEARVLDASTIRLVTAPTRPGRYDVVVVDPSGVEGRATDAFRVTSHPVLSEARPPAGSTDGGTLVLLIGEDFQPGMQVRIGGVDQGPVELEGADRARFETRGGPAGTLQALEIVNPDGASAQGPFAYLEGPDPLLEAVEPSSGPASGGTRVLLHGQGFEPGIDVLFLGDPAGEPVRAPRVELVDEHTLAVETPDHEPGPAALWLQCPQGSGILAESAFTFTQSHGGGGCRASFGAGVGGAHDWLAGTWWWLAALAVLGLRRHRARALLGSAS